MGDVYELEALDGVRMPFNVWPNSKIEAMKCAVPFAAVYTPLKQLQNLMVSVRWLRCDFRLR